MFAMPKRMAHPELMRSLEELRRIAEYPPAETNYEIYSARFSDMMPLVSVLRRELKATDGEHCPMLTDYMHYAYPILCSIFEQMGHVNSKRHNRFALLLQTAWATITDITVRAKTIREFYQQTSRADDLFSQLVPAPSVASRGFTVEEIADEIRAESEYAAGLYILSNGSYSSPESHAAHLRLVKKRLAPYTVNLSDADNFTHYAMVLTEIMRATMFYPIGANGDAPVITDHLGGPQSRYKMAPHPAYGALDYARGNAEVLRYVPILFTYPPDFYVGHRVLNHTTSKPSNTLIEECRMFAHLINRTRKETEEILQ